MPSKTEQVIHDGEAVLVVVAHQGITSYSRSVMPCARKAWRKLPYSEREAMRCEVAELGYRWDRDSDRCMSVIGFGPSHERAREIMRVWLLGQELDPGVRRKLEQPEPVEA